MEVQYHLQSLSLEKEIFAPKSTKRVQKLYPENYKMWMKSNTGDLNKWSDIPWSWGGRFSTGKVSILSKMI